MLQARAPCPGAHLGGSRALRSTANVYKLALL